MDDKILEKHFNDLFGRAYEKNITTFTEFLDLNSQSVLKSSYIPYHSFGGYQQAERIIAAFGDECKAEEYPIDIIEISPVIDKFADVLTHRDFLGGILNLGIKREMLGDIIVKNNKAYIFALKNMSQYITDNIKRIKHTSVNAKIISSLPEDIITPPVRDKLIVSSCRIDVATAGVFKLSRSSSLKLFNQGKIFVNSKICENNSYQLKENDLVSVRGFGRFRYISTISKTKKDRLVISIELFK